MYRLLLCSNTTYGLDISLEGSEGVCLPFVQSILFRGSHDNWEFHCL